MRRAKPSWHRLEELPEYPALNLEVCWVITWRSRDLGFANIGPTFVRYHYGAGPIYGLAKDWDRASRAIVRTIAKNPAGYKKHHRWYIAACRKLEVATRKTFNSKLRGMSNAQLSRLFRTLLDAITAVHTGRAPGWVSEQRFERFTAYVLLQLKRHIASKQLRLDAAQSFSLLTTPTRRTLTNEEAKEVLRLAVFPRQPSRAALKKHLERYWYLTYGLVGPGMTLAELRRRILDAKRAGDPSIALQNRQRQQRKLLEDRRRLLKALQLPRRLRQLLGVAELIGYEKGVGKEIQFRGHAGLARIGEEVGRRFGYTLRQFRWMLPFEVATLLLTGAGPSKRELHHRWEDSGLLVHRRGMHFLRGAALRKFLSANTLEQPTEAKQDIRELRGTPAQAGSAIGDVKIIESPKEMKKMRRGDILVSHMTIPEIVPAMRIAGAVVTDMGGLTCHAAIVSRELGIPCVIGTKVATKVLKNGDRVEVDAERGIVRKLLDRAKPRTDRRSGARADKGTVTLLPRKR